MAIIRSARPDINIHSRRYNVHKEGEQSVLGLRYAQFINVPKEDSAVICELSKGASHTFENGITVERVV